VDELVTQFLVEERIKANKETLIVLDALRRMRKSQGGVGAPLEIPRELQTAIVITDADAAQNKPLVFPTIKVNDI
jgi:hypothetical protein